MPENVAKPPKTQIGARERRVGTRQTMVLRVGILTAGDRTTFCLVRNISPMGVQVRLFGVIAEGSEVQLRLGDEDSLAGRLVWIRDGLAGIEFNAPLDPETMLRAMQKLAPARRRSAPRVDAFARAVLRTGGKTYAAELRDISTSGAKLRTQRPIRHAAVVMLDLPDLPGLRSFVRWSDGNDLGLAFDAPLPIQVIADWINERVAVSG